MRIWWKPWTNFKRLAAISTRRSGDTCTRSRRGKMSERLLPISAAISEIWTEGCAPRERTVREDMMERGFAFRQGRQCYTTPSLIKAYKEALIPCTARSETSEQSSSPSDGARKTAPPTGQRGGSSLSARQMAALPEDELN